MFKGPHVLQFPSLKFEKEVKFGSWASNSKKAKTRMYTLDWSAKDSRCRKEFDEWAKNHWADKNLIYIEPLPEPYNSWTKNLKFALPNRYMEEIRRCTWKSVEEGHHRYSFDTAVRDICCEIRNSYVSVAFRLLADCVYDEETNYFLRYPDKLLVAPCLLYKFWGYQTGWGLLKDDHHAMIDKLEHNIKWRKDRGSDYDKRDAKAVDAFLAAIEDQEKLREERAYAITEDPVAPESAVSLKESTLEISKGTKVTITPSDGTSTSTESGHSTIHLDSQDKS